MCALTTCILIDTLVQLLCTRISFSRRRHFDSCVCLKMTNKNQRKLKRGNRNLSAFIDMYM